MVQNKTEPRGFTQKLLKCQCVSKSFSMFNESSEVHGGDCLMPRTKAELELEIPWQRSCAVFPCSSLNATRSGLTHQSSFVGIPPIWHREYTESDDSQQETEPSVSSYSSQTQLAFSACATHTTKLSRDGSYLPWNVAGFNPQMQSISSMDLQTVYSEPQLSIHLPTCKVCLSGGGLREDSNEIVNVSDLEEYSLGSGQPPMPGIRSWRAKTSLC